MQDPGPSGTKTGEAAIETDIEIKQEPMEPRPQNEVITIDIDDDIILIDTDTTMKYLSGESGCGAYIERIYIYIRMLTLYAMKSGSYVTKPNIYTDEKWVQRIPVVMLIHDKIIRC